MFLFKAHHIELIRTGEKTQTRRTHKRARAKVGSIHQVKSGSWFSDPICLIRFTKVWKEPLHDISEEDAKKEGNYTPSEFVKGFSKWRNISESDEVWVYQFEFVSDVIEA